MRSLLAALGIRPKAPPVRPILVLGDIATQDVDCVVNSADRSMLPGPGVDRRIRQVAGPELTRAMDECPRLHPGQCVATPGFGLKAPHIIHAVAPVWDGPRMQPGRLSGTYVAVLFLARSIGATSVAFPLLGAGAAGWGTQDACEAALEGIAEAGLRPGYPAATLVVNDREAHAMLSEMLGLEVEEPDFTH